MWKCVVAFFVFVTIAVWFSLICFTKISLIGDELLSGFSALDKTNLTEGANDDGFVIEGEKRLQRRKIRHHVPKFMLDLYQRSISNGFNNNINHPDVVRSVIPKNAGFLDSMQIFNDYQDNHLLIFDVPSTDEDEVFVSAELKILTLIEFDPQYLSGLERIVKVSIYDDCTKRLFYLDEARVHHTNNTWLSFNMTTPVNVLLNQNLSESSLKVVISVKAFLPYVSEKGNKFTLSLLPVVEDFEHDYPVLLLTYSSSKENHASDVKLRPKRNVEDDYEEETNNVWDDDPSKKKKLKRIRHSCKKKHLYVDFAEIQYDMWIVQPSGYEAYQCQGRCYYPVADHLSPTKHAIVQALLHSVSPAKVSRSCCVPTKLDSISVLYVDNKGVLTYRYAYKDMVVTECGCR